MVYVDDVVEAWLRVLDAPETFGAVLNVGSGRETSVNDVADAILAARGESRETWDIRRKPEQLGDLRRSAADISAFSALGWSPATDLDEGIASTVAWASSAGLRAALP